MLRPRHPALVCLTRCAAVRDRVSGANRRECIGIAGWAAANAEVRGSKVGLRSDIRFRAACTPIDRRLITAPPRSGHSGR
jgi:hypothetical protein